MNKIGGKTILNGIRILDFTWVLAGPYATRLLADFGAEVIKVQPLLPFGADDAFARGYYETWNRNKLGVTLNMEKPQGVTLAKRLVAVSDVVVENFSPRVMTNWGLDYENLRQLKTDIIMLSMSVMGQTGSWRYYTGFGPTVHALSGLTSLTFFPGGPPMGPGFSYADHVAGLYASLALLEALEYRRRTGEGQHIDVSQVEAMASLLGGRILEESAGNKLEVEGNSSSRAALHNVYHCRGEDRWCAVSVYTDGEFESLKRALGSPSWAKDAKFATLESRLEHRDELDSRVADWMHERTAEEAMSQLQANGVAAGAVQNAADLAADVQLKERDFFISPGITKGKITTDASPIHMSEIPARYSMSAPKPGRDNDYVYMTLLGLNREELKKLKASGVI